MRVRPILALGAAALVLGTALPSQAAKATVLDGKKVKKITKTASGGLQTNDADNASMDEQNRVDCTMPRCLRLTFVYQPAKGVRGNVLFQVKWANPASDIDLYVANDKKAEVASCAGAGGMGEALVLSGRTLKAGRKYTLVADFFRSVNDTVTATVEFPTTRTSGTTVPADADALFPTNCVIDGN